MGVGCQSLRSPTTPLAPPSATQAATATPKEAATPAIGATETPVPDSRSPITPATVDTPVVTATLTPASNASLSPTVSVRTPTPTADLDGALPDPPARDLFDLNRRLRANATPLATRVALGTDLPIGTQQPFWLANIASKSYSQVNTRIVYKTDHAYWYEQSLTDLPAADIKAAADYFESQTYATEHRLFGSELSPGIDGDVHITILLGQIPGVGGYFSSPDEYPASVDPYSNEREMIYINVGSVRPGATSFNGVVAHEFMHMIQFNIHRNQDSWVNEGTADLAAQAVTGITSSGVRSFEQRPDTQLDAWASEPQASVAHYGAAYLFMRYVAEHFGGFQTIGKIVALPGRGTEIFSTYFSGLNPPTTFNQVFADWIAANDLDDVTLAAGKFGYQSFQVHPATQPGPTPGGTLTGKVTQYGTTYYAVNARQSGTIVFSGTPTVPLIGAPPGSGPSVWWSNRGDSIDSRLTREVDLRSVKTATLHYSIWYDTEEGYDYGYVEVSRDGGKTWVTLPAQNTTTLNPNGQNYGNGYTGSSAGNSSAWLQQTVDLGPFAGRAILLRFEYVTDDSYNGDGLAFDDIAIPEIGFRDAPDASGWSADGFTRIANRLAETYLIEKLDATAANPAQIIPVSQAGSGGVQVQAGRSFVLAVSGIAPSTTHQVAYSITYSPN
jgi:hypothetical protein